MKPVTALLTFLSVITLAISVVLTKTNTKNFQNNIAQAPESPQVLSETAPPVTPNPSPSQTPSATAKPTFTPKATATPAPAKAAFDISVLIYPEGAVIERSSTHLAIESTDSPNNINAWYKQMVNKYKGSSKSFSSTNTNGNFLTKMAAAGADGELTIEIKKAAPDTITLIEVDLSK